MSRLFIKLFVGAYWIESLDRRRSSDLLFSLSRGSDEHNYPSYNQEMSTGGDKTDYDTEGGMPDDEYYFDFIVFKVITRSIHGPQTSISNH